MTTDELLEKAVAGGWSPTECETGHYLLDPKLWQAVGKVEGWDDEIMHFCNCYHPDTYEWQAAMHRMIDALAEGKRIDEFLATL